ncbi:WxL protein peptidoglycan domain-containing protein [Acetanaerobacterium elongatum]|uniref:Uncharacterized protein n=1 Tax=Acetanaerobacterium elongatum TaxID=258515 RepID=A0A1G9UFB2_9FIRM|nr:DUF916 domain-containing protein [Acetanaerobacterium elongatum]SDM58631.1 Protein of unknown function C-terminal [Acetanaerobacterium elongatum]
MEGRLFLTAVMAMTVLFSNGSLIDNSVAPFTVIPIYPSNQIEGDAGYFYIDLKAQQTQELSAVIYNNTSSNAAIAVETADCYTSPHGGLIYVTNNTSDDIGYIDRSYMMADHIVPFETQLVLKPNESRTIRFSVAAPSIPEGEAIGAIRFVDAAPRQEDDQSLSREANFQINVKRAITIPVRIRLAQPLTTETPAIQVGDLSFDQDEGKAVLSLSNNLPVINRLAKISYDVFDHVGEHLYEGDFDLEKMAPKTSVMVPIELNGNAISPGRYRVNVNYPIDNTQTDEVSRELVIDNTTAGNMKAESSISEPSSEFEGYFVGIVFVLIAIIIALILLLVRKRKES